MVMCVDTLRARILPLSESAEVFTLWDMLENSKGYRSDRRAPRKQARERQINSLSGSTNEPWHPSYHITSIGSVVWYVLERLTRVTDYWLFGTALV
jgi:hypothetical protein